MVNQRGLNDMEGREFKVVGGFGEERTRVSKIIDGVIHYKDGEGNWIPYKNDTEEFTDVTDASDGITENTDVIPFDQLQDIIDGVRAGTAVESSNEVSFLEAMIVPGVGQVNVYVRGKTGVLVKHFWHVHSGTWIDMNRDSGVLRALTEFLRKRSERKSSEAKADIAKGVLDQHMTLDLPRSAVENAGSSVSNSFPPILIQDPGARKIEQKTRTALPGLPSNSEKWFDTSPIVGDVPSVMPQPLGAPTLVDPLNVHVSSSLYPSTDVVRGDRMDVLEQRLAKQIVPQVMIEVTQGKARAEGVVEKLVGEMGISGQTLDKLIDSLQDLKEKQTGRKNVWRMIKKLFKKS